MLKPLTSSFTIRRVNKTTFLIIEQDKYREHPYIYAKLHPNANILILNDTGCNAPDSHHKDATITRLRPFLETYPVPGLNGRALNPGGTLQYVIILSHCHYDHIGGIEQFLSDDTEIIASAAGRDFIESDLGAHSLCRHLHIPTPKFKVTHWAQSNERLVWPLPKRLPGDDVISNSEEAVDLGMMMLHTPGHTPDALTWYDYDEQTIYVGDSFYRLSDELEPIIFPPQGDLIDWFESLRKLDLFIVMNQPYATGVQDSDHSAGPQSIKLCAAHTTCNVDAFRCIEQARMFQQPLIYPHRKPLNSFIRFGEVFDYYLLDHDDEIRPEAMAMLLPRRLVDYANSYFGGERNQRGTTVEGRFAVMSLNGSGRPE